MEWRLSDERKKQYDNVLKSAQDLETTIGSNVYRLQKLIDLRKDLDTYSKTWWEEVITEMKLEKNRDYMISKLGMIQDITKPKPENSKVLVADSKVGTNATELK